VFLRTSKHIIPNLRDISITYTQQIIHFEMYFCHSRRQNAGRPLKFARLPTMPAILQLTRKLQVRPLPPAILGVRLRNFAGSQDIELWLELRRRAFARQKLGVRDWDASDFAREFLDKAWWRPEAMWFAEDQPQLLRAHASVGTITLARRGDAPDAKPVVHWLAVLPGFRGRGIGRLLMATLEAAVWDAGGRQVWLETHSQWVEAVGFYQALGYQSTDG
jgi:ribosomal protein S18 acetylase RimI-like enzyme